ncbi:low temperature requirement protein A, partial [Micromonospora sp. SL4-19]|uniref:low temperature requirement protein A n=1 Tax=Micromonospora sp. SL4-19 TaxID=3399129 RepID=UPI003A4E611F
SQITNPQISNVVPARGPAEPLLFGGVILYLFGNMLFQLRTLHTLSWTRVATMGLLAICPPLVDRLPALATMALLTLICVGMVAAEVVIFDEGRRALRQLIFEERTAHEAHEAAYRARWHEPNEPDEGE